MPNQPIPSNQRQHSRKLNTHPLPRKYLHTQPLQQRPTMQKPKPTTQQAPQIKRLYIRLQAPQDARLPNNRHPILTQKPTHQHATHKYHRLRTLPQLRPQAQPITSRRLQQAQGPKNRQLPRKDRHRHMRRRPQHRSSHQEIRHVTKRRHPRLHQERQLQRRIRRKLSTQRPQMSTQKTRRPRITPRQGRLLRNMHLLQALHVTRRPQ